MRALLITRSADGGLTRTVLFDTVAQRLRGFKEPTRFHF
jgi:protein-L-isoaspartate(D-aspartate) O-methyltransferase